MKIQVNVLLWSWTSYISLAEEEKGATQAKLKEQLLALDEDKYKDASLTLVFHEESYLDDRDTDELKARPVKNLRHGQSSIQEKKKIEHQQEEASETMREDHGMLKLYQVRGPSTGLPPGSGVSVEGDQVVETLYMVMDREETGSREAPLAGSFALTSTEEKPIAGRARSRRANGKQTRRGKGKNARRRRNVKADRSPKASSDDDNMNNRVLPNGCIQGTSSFVTETCTETLPESACCVGYQACFWSPAQIATVCPNSCNGNFACFAIGNATYVGTNSCNDVDACAFFAESSFQDASRIGTNSCNGEYSCNGMCRSSEDCTATVGDGACIGDRACRYVGDKFDVDNLYIKTVSIGDGSCYSDIDGKSCYNVGSSADTVSIGVESCQKPFSCSQLGLSSKKTVEVGDDSCGLGSCEQFGLESTEDIKVGDGSCLDGRGCAYFGRNAHGPVEVGDFSCSDFYSCYKLGYNTNESVRVDDAACNSTRSCFYFGSSIVSEDVLVASSECTMANKCAGSSSSFFSLNPACNVTAMVPNGDGLCPSTT